MKKIKLSSCLSVFLFLVSCMPGECDSDWNVWTEPYFTSVALEKSVVSKLENNILYSVTTNNDLVVENIITKKKIIFKNPFIKSELQDEYSLMGDSLVIINTLISKAKMIDVKSRVEREFDIPDDFPFSFRVLGKDSIVGAYNSVRGTALYNIRSGEIFNRFPKSNTNPIDLYCAELFFIDSVFYSTYIEKDTIVVFEKISNKDSLNWRTELVNYNTSPSNRGCNMYGIRCVKFKGLLHLGIFSHLLVLDEVSGKIVYHRNMGNDYKILSTGIVNNEIIVVTQSKGNIEIYKLKDDQLNLELSFKLDISPHSISSSQTHIINEDIIIFGPDKIHKIDTDFNHVILEEIEICFGINQMFFFDKIENKSRLIVNKEALKQKHLKSVKD